MGARWPFLVTVEAPGQQVPDGDGGYTEAWGPLDPPAWDCAIEPAAMADLERVSVGTVATTATHIVRGPYRPGVTADARITNFEGRVFLVNSVRNVDEADRQLVLVCSEVIT